jgi:hypothetical protein
MIPYAELERALQRWKARQAGEPSVDVAAPVDSDRVTVESDYVEADAEEAFPSRQGGTNEIIVVGDVDEN